MASHRIALCSIIFMIYMLFSWNIYGSIASNDYILTVIASNGSGYLYNYGECETKGARFGREITSDETVTGCPIAASPRDGCENVTLAPSANSSSSSSFECIGGYFAVVARGNCTFAQKAYRAQQSGYSGLIVYNNANDPIEMANDDDYGTKVTIPAFMVGYECGMLLADKYSYSNGFAFYIRAYWSYQDLMRYLIPFVSVIGVCFLVMLSAMVIKLIRDRRRKQRRRLSKKHLKQIPTRKFNAGDEPETCPICLDDFVVGDRLRVLPCAHSYHSACIDPWLLKNRRVCPICKRKVLPKAPGSTQSDSETEETTPSGGDATAGPSGAPSTPERTPLLTRSEHTVQVGNSTFYGVYDNPDGPGDEENGGAIVPSATFDSAIGTTAGSVIVLSTASTPDYEQSSTTPEDPTIDVDSRQSLIPQSSIQSDECTQAGFVTASSSFREGYANPNFVVDAHDDVDVESGAADDQQHRGPRSDMV